MKKSLLILMLALAMTFTVSACPAVLTADTNLPVEVAHEISREEYITILAEEKNISYEEAEKLDEEQSLRITKAPDEIVRYATLEKSAGAIHNNADYWKSVNIVVYAKYLYNTATHKLVELIEITAPYAYIPGVGEDRTSFDHGDYAITKESTTKSSVVVNGSFTYTDPGIGISAGGDILGVSYQLGGTVITTRAITLKATFFLSDCA